MITTMAAPSYSDRTASFTPGRAMAAPQMIRPTTRRILTCFSARSCGWTLITLRVPLVMPPLLTIHLLASQEPMRFTWWGCAIHTDPHLIVADVGQGMWEEIDIGQLGGNFGWRIWEGNHCTNNDPGLCDPAGFVF